MPDATMIDSHGRRIDYLRVSVTDRCNLRCVYCRPPEGVALIPREDILSYEEIAAFVRTAVAHGITKVRLTGGEPLVRRDIETLVAQLAAVDGIRDLAMTTNGTLLADHATALAAAGLHRVNVSLDAVTPARFAEITRGGDVALVLAGIEAALAAGLDPVKLNCVVDESPEEPDAVDVAAYGDSMGLDVRFIRRIDTAEGRFWPVIGGEGGRCESCNRLRLSSDGYLRPCLLGDAAFSVRELGADEALRCAVAAKPDRGRGSASNRMYSIGG